MPREGSAATVPGDLRRQGLPEPAGLPVVRLFRAASGDLTAARVERDGGERLLHSRIDPVAEAEEWTGWQRRVRNTAVVIGAGLGYCACALAGRHPGITAFWLVESDPQLLRAAAAIPAFVRLLRDRPCRLVAGRDQRDLCNPLLSGLAGEFSLHITPSAPAVEPALYGAVTGVLQRRLYEIRSAGGDDDGGTGARARARSVDLLIEEMLA